MNALVLTGQVTPAVVGRPESQPDWFSKGGQTFLSTSWNAIASWKNCFSVIEAEAQETDKALGG